MRALPRHEEHSNIVEYQCGSRESTQSTDMNVTLKPQKIRPGPASAAIFPWTRAPLRVFPGRPAVEKPREQNPSGEVEPPPASGERHVQIDLLVLEDFSAATHLGVRPRYRLGMPIAMERTSARPVEACAPPPRTPPDHYAQAPPVRYCSISRRATHTHATINK